MYVLLSIITAVALAGPAAPTVVSPADIAPSAVAAQQQNGETVEPVEINKATAEELQKVPGIGETLALRIIEFRQQNGNFETVDDLLNVRGIGVASLEKLRPYLFVEKSG